MRRSIDRHGGNRHGSRKGSYSSVAAVEQLEEQKRENSEMQTTARSVAFDIDKLRHARNKRGRRR